MEHHHFDQCVMILNSEGNNIFQVKCDDEIQLNLMRNIARKYVLIGLLNFRRCHRRIIDT